MFFAAGLATFLQSLIGCRLPIMQGASFTFVTPGLHLNHFLRHAALSAAQSLISAQINLRHFEFVPQIGVSQFQKMLKCKKSNCIIYIESF